MEKWEITGARDFILAFMQELFHWRISFKCSSKNAKLMVEPEESLVETFHGLRNKYRAVLIFNQK